MKNKYLHYGIPRKLSIRIDTLAKQNMIKKDELMCSMLVTGLDNLASELGVAFDYEGREYKISRVNQCDQVSEYYTYDEKLSRVNIININFVVDELTAFKFEVLAKCILRVSKRSLLVRLLEQQVNIMEEAEALLEGRDYKPTRM